MSHQEIQVSLPYERDYHFYQGGKEEVVDMETKKKFFNLLGFLHFEIYKSSFIESQIVGGCLGKKIKFHF